LLEMNASQHMVMVDKLHLTNVVYNLMDNAVKYCKNKPRIEIRTSNDDKHIILEIIDNGIGIEKKYLKKIFDKFFRVPTGNVHNVRGFGIGLNYVKNIIQSHKCLITVESKPGIGTTFSIIIPIKKNSQ